jgi:methylenetetrahydrofolate dehydrogenase (NADP+)/methenyltetrahydrofolate cyclohydrolase
MATILDGKKLASDIKKSLAHEVSLLEKNKITPGLAVILIGENPASKIYVKNKRKACDEVGIESFDYNLPEATSQEEIEKLIRQLNADKRVHGILVQLPLPPSINEQAILELIDPAKDVDGFHPVNMGKLVSGLSSLRPCTPLGIIAILDSIGYQLEGRQAVVVGRSNIVGKPVALLLLERHATVTICHSRTHNLSEIIKSADVVVAAVGVPKFVNGDWIKPGAVVIDVGINRMDDGSIVGDVDFQEASKHASAITPVPGGVGPMTIAMLLSNVVEAAKHATLNPSHL